jgi:membrane protein implicated in regulation of membrane protease activity
LLVTKLRARDAFGAAALYAKFMLLVVGAAMYISGGFQVLWDDLGLPGVAGFIVVFLLAAMVFMISVRRSLKWAMEQDTRTTEPEDWNG